MYTTIFYFFILIFFFICWTIKCALLQCNARWLMFITYSLCPTWEYAQMLFNSSTRKYHFCSINVHKSTKVTLHDAQSTQSMMSLVPMASMLVTTHFHHFTFNFSSICHGAFLCMNIYSGYWKDYMKGTLAPPLAQNETHKFTYWQLW